MIRRLAVSVLLAILVVVVPATTARADDSAPITQMHVDVEMQPDGRADVTMDFTMDFGQRSGRGPIFLFYTAQEDGQDSSEEYVFDFSRPTVSSPTGAATDLHLEEGRNVVEWRIGDEDRFNRDPQDYRLEFTIDGMAWDPQPESGLAEINWQVFSDVDSRIQNFSATISGPTAVERAACWTGPDNRTECDSASVSDGKAELALAQIPYGQGIQIVGGFPSGTFGGATPAKRKVPTLGSNLVPEGATLPAAGGLSLAALIGSVVVGRRAKRDLVYLGLTPGTVPTDNRAANVGLKDTSKIPVAVQFQPPAGARPGEIGTLIDATADGVDVSATLIDLAVRGYLTIEPRPQSSNFTMHLRNADWSELENYEATLLRQIFDGEGARTMRQLQDRSYHTVMSGARDRLYRRMVDRHWFVANPKFGNAFLTTAGVVLLGVGGLLAFLLWNASLALWGLPFIILGLGLFFIGASSKRRTARGSAMLQQARGFELYLRTAEANQIKFEEGIDVFSRYLPYAMIFGVADRWARIFEDLERAGRYQIDRSWTMSDHIYGAYWYSSMANSFGHSFDESMANSVADHAAAQAASSGSSGGSGFSGGGGFGGGSVGSW